MLHYTYSLYPPGKRRGYKFWLAIVRVGRESFEIRTGETTKKAAERAARIAGERLVAEIAAEQSSPLKAGSLTPFRQAADAYLAFRDNPKVDVDRLAKVCVKLGQQPIGEITANDLITLANQLHPKGAPATKNREVLRPAASVLHYIHETTGDIPWIRVKFFKEPKPRNRPVSTDIANLLISNADDPDLKLLLIWLFHQGNRISEALRVEWKDIDLGAGTFEVHITKPEPETRTVDLAPEVIVALGNVELKEGRVFHRWSNRWSVSRPIRALAQKLGVTFSAHMARHSMATWATAAGVNPRTIMDMGNWRDPKSMHRYQGSDIKTVRAARTKMPKLVG